MPRKLSAWVDLLVQLGALLLMIFVLWQYNKYVAAVAFFILLMIAAFSRKHYKERQQKFEEYCENVIASGNEMMSYAMANIPQAVMVIDDKGRLRWHNDITKNYVGFEPEDGTFIQEFWEGLLRDEVLEITPEENINLLKSGKYVTKIIQKKTSDNGAETVEIAHYFSVIYRQIAAKADYPRLIALFVQDITSHENLKTEYEQSRTVLMYVQVDNFDEIMQGLNETEKASMMLSVNAEIEKWMNELSGFMQRVHSDLFIAVIENLALEKAIEGKFAVLDRIRQIISKNGIPVTLSIGIAVADKNPTEQSMTELGNQAQERLNAALARGGDQVAISIDGKIQYFGGRAKAVEKHNRVRARVMANSIREHMEAADEIFIMPRRF